MGARGLYSSSKLVGTSDGELLMLLELVRDSRLEAVFDDKKRTTEYVPVSHRQRKNRQIWKRQRILGSGGYGVVSLKSSKGQSGQEPSFCAVKELRTQTRLRDGGDYVRELEALAKFSQRKVREPATRLAILDEAGNHKLSFSIGITFVLSHGWYENPQGLCIAMEFCRHGDMKNFLKTQGPIPEICARDAIRQIAQGLLHMQSNVFAHRDLKPSVN
ncbi:kinase-like domain-containing protein [Xylariaceae sp. FL1272]|nr:kinase-like domain-containing protein [Xylariaceae sp. FL1272]